MLNPDISRMLFGPEVTTAFAYFEIVQLPMYGGIALVTCFFPLAGILGLAAIKLLSPAFT